MLSEPARNRIRYILREKPEKEQIVRLDNFRPVLSKLSEARAELDKAWAELDKARADYNKAWAELDKARADYNKARAEYNKARVEYNKAWADYNKVEITRLHKLDVPDHTWNGKSIF